MRQPDNDAERPHPSCLEPQARQEDADLLDRDIARRRDDPHYSEWRNGKVISRYLDANWRPVALGMLLSFNRQRRLSLAQLDALARLDSRELSACYQDILSPEHLELIKEYRETYSLELEALSAAREAAAEAASEELGEPWPRLGIEAVGTNETLAAVSRPLPEPATEETDPWSRMAAAVAMIVDLKAQMETGRGAREIADPPPEEVAKSQETVLGQELEVEPAARSS